MEILQRKDAKSAGLPTYYTGKLCKNGHLNYRYTNSGACKDCVHESAALVRVAPSADASQAVLARAAALDAAAQKKANAVEAAERRRATMRDLTKKYFIVNPKNWPEVRSVIYMLTQCRYPELTEVDIVPDKCAIKPIGASWQYCVNINAEDFTAIQVVSDGVRTEDRLAYEAALFASTPGALDRDTLRYNIAVDKHWQPIHCSNQRKCPKRGLYWTFQNGHSYLHDDLTQLERGIIKFAKPM